MMNVTEALEAAKKYYQERDGEEVLEAYDADGIWIFFGGVRGEREYGRIGISIDKETGEIKNFLLPSAKNFQILKESKKIEC